MLQKIVKNIASKPFYMQCRFRTFSRRPLKVLTNSEAQRNIKPIPVARAPEQLDPTLKTRGMIKTSEGSFVFNQLKETDEIFMKKMIAMKSKKKREESSSIILEGRRLIVDAIDAGIPADCIFFTLKDNLEGVPLGKLSKDVELFKASQKQMQAWSDLTTCPGIMGIFKKPEYDDLVDQNKNNFPVSVICDNVREPGNMGSILRCAAAVGCAKVYVIKGCVDVWDTKVLRTGCGAHFHLPIVKMGWEDLENHFPLDVAVYLADNTCSVIIEHSEDDKENIPSHMYSDIAYGDSESVVVVGGETEGLSEEARVLALRLNGVRTFIPMENKTDSLNSAMALSIILFEMKRQYQAFGENSELTIND